MVCRTGMGSMGESFLNFVLCYLVSLLLLTLLHRADHLVQELVIAQVRTCRGAFPCHALSAGYGIRQSNHEWRCAARRQGSAEHGDLISTREKMREL